MFRRRVSRRDQAGVRESLAYRKSPGAAKINQDRAPVAVEEDVVGFDVAVQQAARVNRLERAAQLDNQVLGLFERQQTLLEPPPQILTLEQFHHQIRAAVFLEGVPHPHDAGMGELGQQPRFFYELELGLGKARRAQASRRNHVQTRSSRAVGKEFLYRHPATQQSVCALIGDAKTPLAQHFTDAVAATQ